MAQFDITTCPNESGSAHLTRNASAGSAINSDNKGPSAPSYAEAGTRWLDDSGTPWIMKQYDGADWIPLYTVDASGNVLGFDPDTFDIGSSLGGSPIASIEDEDDMVSDSATALATQQSIKAYVDAARKAPETIAGSTRGLVITRPTAATVLITAGEAFVYDATSGKVIRHISVSETVDITSSGANGLDTGTEAANTWYFIWLIGKADGTIDSLLSISSTAPTMPSGYTYKLLVGAVRNDGSSNFKDFIQEGVNAWYIQEERMITSFTTAIAGWRALTSESVTVGDFFPAIAKKSTVIYNAGSSAQCGWSSRSDGFAGDYGPKNVGAAVFGIIDSSAGSYFDILTSRHSDAEMYIWHGHNGGGKLNAFGWELE